MKISFIGNLIFSALVLAGVTTDAQARKKHYNVAPVFDVGQHHEYTLNGGGSINGQAFLRQKGGGVVTCAGQPVFLIPDTGYFREIFRIAKDGGTMSFPNSEEIKKTGRMSTCNATGYFKFNNLPPARWIVVTQVAWSAGYDAQGGVLMKTAQTDGVSEQEIFLVEADFVGR